MVDVSKVYPNPVNINSLLATVRATYPEVSTGENGFRVHNIAPENEATVSADLDAMIAAHNPSVLTDEQQLAQAAAIALEQGKIYLRNQLIAEDSPDATAIFNTIFAQVQSNEYLLRMVVRERDLLVATFGWGVLDTGTAVGRLRYIFVVQQVIALLT